MVQQPFLAIDHVQLAMPAGREDDARAFFVGLLGMNELEKPAELRSRGGAWFVSGSVQVHVGVEEPFRPARKAHVALRCAAFDALTARLGAAGHALTPADGAPDGARRAYVDDPFGNRIELIAAAEAAP